jgi:hypothetical protein
VSLTVTVTWQIFIASGQQSSRLLNLLPNLMSVMLTVLSVNSASAPKAASAPTAAPAPQPAAAPPSSTKPVAEVSQPRAPPVVELDPAAELVFRGEFVVHLDESVTA